MIVKLLGTFMLITATAQNDGCHGKKKEGPPSCIREIIKEYESKPKQNPPVTIYQYDYMGQKVFYVTAPCCDQMNMMYDTSCNIICHPDGGFTGKGDGQCSDFAELKTNAVLIYSDNR